MKQHLKFEQVEGGKVEDTIQPVFNISLQYIL